MSNETEQVFLPDSPSNQRPAMLRPANGPPTINLENVEDFSKVCRVCATITDLVMPIFSGEGLRINLADKIKRHLPIKVCATDALPLVVCYQCASTLLATHELVACSQQADAALRTALSAQERQARQRQLQQQPQQVKQEPAARPEDCSDDCRRCEYCPLVVMGVLYNAHLLEAHSNLLFHCDECDSYIARKNFLPHMTAHAVQYDAEGRVARKPTNPNGRLYVLRPPGAPLQQTTTAATDSTTRSNNPTNTATNISSTIEAACDGEGESSDAEAVESLPPLESSAPTAPTASTEPVTSPELNESVESAQSPEPTETMTRRVRQCPHCPRTYTAASSYFYHLKYTHGKSREHECPTCGRRFGTRGALREHTALHEPAAALQCDRCDKRFRSKAGRYIHMQTHTDVKKFSCAECGRAFRWSAALRRHAARHGARRAHACECGRAFSVRADLLRHARTHRRAAPALACPHAPCRATFAQPRYLRAHVARKHNHAPPPSPPTDSAVVSNDSNGKQMLVN